MAKRDTTVPCRVIAISRGENEPVGRSLRGALSVSSNLGIEAYERKEHAASLATTGNFNWRFGS